MRYDILLYDTLLIHIIQNDIVLCDMIHLYQISFINKVYQYFSKYKSKMNNNFDFQKYINNLTRLYLTFIYS